MIPGITIEVTIRIALAALLTMTLFLIMRFLITPGNDVPQKVEESSTINISRHERDENTQRKERNKPNKPEKQPPPPPPLVVQPRPRNISNDNALVVDIPILNSNEDLGQLRSPSDRRAIPIVRIPPQYPNRPLSRGIEGWVLLEFTISTTGSVQDVKVIDSEPKGVFDRSALRAIKRWKYQPKLVKGKPVLQMNMQELVTYKIEN